MSKRFSDRSAGVSPGPLGAGRRWALMEVIGEFLGGRPSGSFTCVRQHRRRERVFGTGKHGVSGVGEETTNAEGRGRE